MRTQNLILTVLLASSTLGCGEGALGTGSPSPSGLEPLTRDLSVGSRGADVQAVNEYLARFGYFPNEELAGEFPAWRPIISQGPDTPEVYDAQTAEGIRRLQAANGIAATGVVDQATRDLLGTARCGVPDGINRLDPSDKFALEGGGYYSRNALITYRVANGLANQFTAATAQSIAAGAFQIWANEVSYNAPSETIGLIFAPTTGAANITFQFGGLPSGVTGQTSGQVPSTITLSNSVVWSLANIGTSNYNLQGVMTHEIGHALGLAHSSIGRVLVGARRDVAVMYPSASAQETFSSYLNPEVDDEVAISARYDNYKTLEGGNPGARDIAVGANGSIWAIGSEPFGDGYRVLRYDGLHWSGTQGGAVRVAVAPDGTPWVVTATGWIFHAASDSAGTTWGSPLPTNSPGIASDIGVGYNGDVWVIGGACGRPDCAIYKWNPANGGSWVGDRSGGAAVRITVGHMGVPWVLNSAKNFYRYTTNDPMTGTWQQMPGQSDDLAIGPGDPSLAVSGTTQIDYTWSIGRLNSGLISMEVWDEQATNNEGSPHPTNPFTWVGEVQPCAFDTTSAVAVGPRGEPYVVCNGGQVITPFR